MAEQNPNPDIERLRQLTLEKCSGELTEDGVRELSQLLESSETARRTYWELIILDAQLDWTLGATTVADSSILKGKLDLGVITPATTNKENTFRSLGRLIAIAASLVLIVSGAWWMSNRGGDSSVQIVAQNTEVESNTPMLGSVSELVAQSRWSIGQSESGGKNIFYQGDTVRVEEGGIELRFKTGAIAVLESPVTLRMLSLDRVRLIRGAVMIDVPKDSQGVAVETASAEVIDIGTTYSVKLAGEQAEIVVFDGQVDLKPTLPSDVGIGNQQGSNKRLRAGEAVRMAADGTLSRIVSVQKSTLQAQRDDEPSPLVIASVKDNNNREGFYNFYEIVPSGMSEDAEAFVDRPHQWNGTHQKGMPTYLIGGDYIKTFNDDKVADDIQVDVTLGRPATIYVLLDDRVTPPEWLLTSFVDTGDDIGVDEAKGRVGDDGTWQSSDDSVFVGPGRSIDRTHSIWKQVIPESGVVSLGPNGQLSSSLRRELMANMYGVVAVALQDAN